MDLRQHIMEIGRRLWQRNMLAAADGNISCRQDEQILITPSGKSLAFLSPQDMVTIDADGRPIGEGRPSSETPMHLEVYRRCRKARAALHAHPPCAIAWGLARPDLQELPAEAFAEVILACGRIPILPYATPGGEAMACAVGEMAQECRTIILGRHGALSWGESLEEAWMGMERIEHSAQILLAAESLGGATSLPPEEISKLQNMRSKMGGATR